jgi:hypothetical protein
MLIDASLNCWKFQITTGDSYRKVSYKLLILWTSLQRDIRSTNSMLAAFTFLQNLMLLPISHLSLPSWPRINLLQVLPPRPQNVQPLLITSRSLPQRNRSRRRVTREERIPELASTWVHK